MVAGIPVAMLALRDVFRAAGDTGPVDSILPVATTTLFILLGLVYLNYAPEPTSLNAKFVGAGLVAVVLMTFVQTVSVDGIHEVRSAYTGSDAPWSVYFEPLPDSGYRAEGRAPVMSPAIGDTLPAGDDTFEAIASPFPLVAYGQRFDSLYVGSNGIVTFPPPPDSLTRFSRASFFDLEGPTVAVLDMDLAPHERGSGPGLPESRQSHDHVESGALSMRQRASVPSAGADRTIDAVRRRRHADERGLDASETHGLAVRHLARAQRQRGARRRAGHHARPGVARPPRAHAASGHDRSRGDPL